MSRSNKYSIDLTGCRFGRWTVLERDLNNKHDTAWICRCDCGTERSVRAICLINNRSKSCGCLRNEINAQKYYKHGGIHDRLYHIWSSMKQRCYNPNSRNYNDYGGKGITICEEWLNSYDSFKKWAFENGYDSNAEQFECTIDRIDFNKGYSPDNCRWVSAQIQNNNKRNVISYEYNGETHTLYEWSVLLNFNCDRARRRLYDGWTFEDAITKDHQRIAKTYTYNGESHTVGEWAEILNTTDKSIYTRLEKGWSIDRVFSQPFRKRGELTC